MTEPQSQPEAPRTLVDVISEYLEEAGWSETGSGDWWEPHEDARWPRSLAFAIENQIIREGGSL